MLAVLDSQRRYHVFDNNTLKHLVKIVKDLATYTVEGPVKKKSLDIFYDSPTKILEENNLILRKRVYGAKSYIKLKRSNISPNLFFADNLRRNEREKEVPTKDPLSKHFFFLNNALNSMYTNALKFDPDKLFEKMQVTLTIDVNKTTYKVFGPGGFKVEINSDNLKVRNYQTNRKNTSELIQIKLVSPDSTLPYYEDFIKRVEKHCKEIFYTTDSRHDIALRITKPLPSKEEQKAAKLARQKQQKEEEGEENF